MVAGKSLTQWRPEDHPRDSKGRFRTKWGVPKGAKDAIEKMLQGFESKDFPDDKAAAAHLRAMRKKARSKKQQDALDYFLTPEGNVDIQSTLRAGGRDTPQIAAIRSMFEPLQEDLLVTRVMGPDAFGLPPERIGEVEEWTGKRADDLGFMPTNVGTPHVVSGPHVTMSMVVPKGTRAIVVGDGENRTVILEDQQPFRFIRFQPDGNGGSYAISAITPRTQGDSEAPMALGKELPKKALSPAVDATPEELAKRGIDPNETPLSQQPLAQPPGFPGSEAAPAPPPSPTSAAPTKALPPPDPADIVPADSVPSTPDQTMAPAKAIKKAGKAVPRGAGRVTQEGDTEAPEDTRLDPRKRASRGVIDEDVARERDTAQRLAAREKVLADREARAQKAVDAADRRQDRLDARQARLMQQQEAEIDRKDARIQELEGQLESEPRTSTLTPQGRPQAADLTPAVLQSVLDRDAQLKAANPDYPRNDDESEISQLADDIRALGAGRKPSSGLAKAAKKVAKAPAKKAAAPAAPAKAPAKAAGPTGALPGESEEDALERGRLARRLRNAIRSLGTRTGVETVGNGQMDLSTGRKDAAGVATDLRRAASRLRSADDIKDTDIIRRRSDDEPDLDVADRDVGTLNRLADELDGGAGAAKATKAAARSEAAKKARKATREGIAAKRVRKVAEPSVEEAVPEEPEVTPEVRKELATEAVPVRKDVATQPGFIAARRAEQGLKGDKKPSEIVKDLRDAADRIGRMELEDRQVTKRGDGETNEQVRDADMARLRSLADGIEGRIAPAPAKKVTKRAKKVAAEAAPEVVDGTPAPVKKVARAKKVAPADTPGQAPATDAGQARVARVASQFHEDWRKTRLQSDGTFEPRIKMTKDS